MEEIPTSEEEMLPLKGDITHKLSKELSQEVATESEVPTRTSSII